MNTGDRQPHTGNGLSCKLSHDALGVKPHLESVKLLRSESLLRRSKLIMYGFKEHLVFAVIWWKKNNTITNYNVWWEYFTSKQKPLSPNGWKPKQQFSTCVKSRCMFLWVEMCACFTMLTVLILLSLYCSFCAYHCYCCFLDIFKRTPGVPWALCMEFTAPPLLWLYYPECQHHPILWMRGATAPLCWNHSPLLRNCGGIVRFSLELCFHICKNCWKTFLLKKHEHT